MKKRLPAWIFGQPKRGFISPTAKWLRRPDVQDYVWPILSPDYYPETAGLFRWDEIQNMYRDHIDKVEYNLTPLWCVIVFQVWAKKFKIKAR